MRDTYKQGHQIYENAHKIYESIGEQYNKVSENRRKLSEIEKQKTFNYIQRLLDLGHNVSEIADFLDRSKSWVYLTIKTNKLKRKEK